MTSATGAAGEALFPGTLLDVLRSRAGGVAFEDGSRLVSCGELLRIVGSLVGALRAKGVGRGSAVAVLTGVTVEGFAANVAVHALGCQVVGIRPGWSPPQLAAVLDRGLDAVVGDPSTLTPDLLAAIEQAASPVQVLSLGADPGTADLLTDIVPASGLGAAGVDARADTGREGVLGSADGDARADAGRESALGSADGDARAGTGRESALGSVGVDVTAGTGRAGALGSADRDATVDSGRVPREGKPRRAAEPSMGEAIEVEARPDDVARINFTSGSTGLPKGCVRSYRTFSLQFQPDRWAPDLARLISGFGRVLVHASFAHPVMLTFAARSLVTGGTVILPEAQLRSFLRLAEAIERHQVTGVVMPVPALHQLLADVQERGRDVSCLQALVVTGSPASPELLATATEQLGPVVWQGYGQAESGMISLLTPDDIAGSPEQALTSVGRLLPEVELRVVDPGSGRHVGPGEVGEIWVRSPHAMAGYWDDPEQTREVLADGWLHTQDLGRLDAGGFLHLTGRSRDVVMVNAEVCYTVAVEQALAGHPDVDQAYAVGVPDEQTGEAIHAFVVPVANRPVPDREALTPLVRANLTPNHVPATITPLPVVPTTSNGKPDKQALTKLAVQGST